MQRELRRRTGAYETPPPLARLLAERTLAGLPGPLTILDPACGTGALLRAAASLRPDLTLTGMDRDRTALATAPGERIRGDALLREWGGRTFDVVLANPPWVSFSGRHAKPLAAAERALLGQRYESFRGWPTLHAPFVELALSLATLRVGILLPAQVRELERYAPLRRVWGVRGRVMEWIDLGEHAFAGVTQPACALILELGKRAAPAPERAQTSPGLFADIGVHTGNAAARLLDRGGLPLREGRDLAPYVLASARRTILADLVREGDDYWRVPSIEVHREMPILIRQTAARPIAALHREPAHFRNSLLACRGIPGVPDELVVAWLNSAAVGEFHSTHVRESHQRAFPQVKVRHLRALPLPRWERASAEVRDLARLVAREGRLDLAPDLDRVVSDWLGS